MNKHPTKWKKIFTCHIPHKGMISKLLHNNKNSTDNPIKKWAEEQTLSEEKQNDNSNMINYSTSFIIREMQITLQEIP